MAQASDIQRIQQQIRQRWPEIQDWVYQNRPPDQPDPGLMNDPGGGAFTGDATQGLQNISPAAEAFGIDIPDGYMLLSDGSVVENPDNKWAPFIPLAVVGGLGVADALIGGGAGAAAGSSALPSTPTVGSIGSLVAEPASLTGVDLASFGVPAAVGGAGASAALDATTPMFRQTVEGVVPSELSSSDLVSPIGALAPNLDPNLRAGLEGDSSDPLASIGKWAKLLGAIGSGISGATNQSAQNRLAQNDPYVQRGRLEDDQRTAALKREASADYAFNPVHSPFDPSAARMPSEPYASTLRNLQSQDSAMLAKPPSYDVTGFPSLQAGTLEQIGRWAGPILRTLGILKTL